MWKLLTVALLCYGLFAYWQSPLAPNLLGDDDLGNMVIRDSILTYIKTHSALAIEEMQRAKIPASITLSQAILESRFGTSLLAQQANNHFGIKANPHWDGKDRHCSYSYEWSNRREGTYLAFSCFRRYPNTENSYSDHSDFLTTRPYYTSLFELPLRDWRAWAKGLQAAGYATDPNYATKLMDLIERYELQKFDQISATLQQHSEAKGPSLTQASPQ